jgi:hypothetical protein
MRLAIAAAAALLVLGAPYRVDSQAIVAGAELSYADAADLALAASVAAHVRVARASALRRREAPDVAPGHRRFYVEADILSLIRGPGALPARVSYLVDLPNDARGRAARIPRRAEYVLLATAVAGRPGELRLVAPDAQLAYSPALADRIRSILREAIPADAPPRVTAVGRAFHVPGSIPGESETQIFLQTANERPVSLTVLRRPGERPRWAVSLSELVDDNALTPRPESLLWYRLACTLPRALPPQSLADASASEADAIRSDYRLVLESLGPCVRNRRLR